ncbi:MAG TPA: GTP cyclohydrolase I [Acidimicrobiia bacterium]|nr:GTP cyclohydrolase I [Acidimicrobiia bacterium]
MSLPAETLPVSFPVTTFENDAAYDELVIVSDVAFVARCDCHGLAYAGLATVGYLPGDRIVGLSKLVRLVEHYATGSAEPVRLANVVADGLERTLRSPGLGVVVDAGPTCGHAGLDSAHQITTATRGRLREHSNARSEFLVRARPRRRNT